MAAPEQPKNHYYEHKDGDFLEIEESGSECDSDDSMKDPCYITLEEETDGKFSKLSIRGKSKARFVKDDDLGSEADLDEQEVVVPELDEKDETSFEIVQKIIEEQFELWGNRGQEAGQIEKLKVEQCKLYLRKNGLRLTGNKGILIERIKQHLEILNGGGEKKYPASSFVLNCKGDACTGDVVMFEQNVYEMFDIASRTGRGPPCGTRIVAGRIVKESYGAAKQQHTFTIEVLWSKGEKPLPPLHPLLIKGRNLYRLKTLRQRWENEGERQKVLMEKHSRGSLARSDREARVQEKEMRKMIQTKRVSRKAEPKRNQSQFDSTSELKSLAQPQQSGSLVNSVNLHHQLFGPLVDSRNMKIEAHQLGLFTDTARPATQPQAPKSSFFVDSGSIPYAPTIKLPSFNQKRHQRQPLASMNHFLPTNPGGQKQMCRHYAQGRCYYGDSCKYSHEMPGNCNERREERWPHEQRNSLIGMMF